MNKKVSNQLNDPGLGARYFKQTKRIINPDGSFNVQRKGIGLSTRNIYHYLINCSWLQFLLWVFAVYILLNSFFAVLYVMVGVGRVDMDHMSAFDAFLQGFFFSVQTFTTVGYGLLAPRGIAGNIVASLEALVGLLGFALATGLLYGRFSKPTARISFSKNVLVSPHKDGKALMFRIVNTRKSELLEMEATVMLTFVEHKNENEFERRYFRLNLDIPNIVFFPLSWTLVHTINDDSPLASLTKADLEQKNAEILVMIKGFDDTFSQTVYSRYSYMSSDIEWDQKFVRPFYTNEKGDIVMPVDEINKKEKV